jgi:hypothetical protein
MVFYASILLEEFDAKLDSHLASGFSPEVRMTNARYMLEVTEAQLERMRARLDDRGVTVGPSSVSTSRASTITSRATAPNVSSGGSG